MSPELFLRSPHHFMLLLQFELFCRKLLELLTVFMADWNVTSQAVIIKTPIMKWLPTVWQAMEEVACSISFNPHKKPKLLFFLVKGNWKLTTVHSLCKITGPACKWDISLDKIYLNISLDKIYLNISYSFLGHWRALFFILMVTGSC